MRKVIFCICLLLTQSLTLAAQQPINYEPPNFMNTLQLVDFFDLGDARLNRTRYSNVNGTLEIVNDSNALTKTYCANGDCQVLVRLELKKYPDTYYCLLRVGTDPSHKNSVEVRENGQHGLHCKVTTEKPIRSNSFTLYNSKIRYSTTK